MCCTLQRQSNRRWHSRCLLRALSYTLTLLINLKYFIHPQRVFLEPHSTRPISCSDLQITGREDSTTHCTVDSKFVIIRQNPQIPMENNCVVHLEPTLDKSHVNSRDLSSVCPAKISVDGYRFWLIFEKLQSSRGHETHSKRKGSSHTDRDPGDPAVPHHPASHLLPRHPYRRTTAAAATKQVIYKAGRGRGYNIVTTAG